MAEPLPAESWPDVDMAVAALWDEVTNVDKLVEETTFFPGGRSKGDVRNDVANAKQAAQFFSDQGERLKRGDLESPTAFMDWKNFPSKVVEPLLKGITESADLSSVHEFVDAVVVKSGKQIASAIDTGLPFVAAAALLLVGVYVFAKLT